MVLFAYVECGLSVDEFMNLSFFEWNCEIERVRKKNKEFSIQWEGSALLFGELMALIANVNRDRKKKPTPFMRSDFIKLSFDKDSEPETKRMMTPEEVEKKFGKVKFDRGKSILN